MDPVKFSVEIFNTPLFSDEKCLELFQFQSRMVPIYTSFIEALKINPAEIRRIQDIPFLPIEFFKTHRVLAAGFQPAICFTSSGTTGSVISQHAVSHPEIYKKSFQLGFHMAFPEHIKQGTAILGLLPSYLERSGSSLVYMVEQLIQDSNEADSGFFLHNQEELFQVIQRREAQGKSSILLGVTYALLDFAERFPCPLKHTVIMETGGMKGRRREMIREEVHSILTQAWGVRSIASEYGMTELLSQAYAQEHGKFTCPPWMKVLVRDNSDPLSIYTEGKGALNVIDLANTTSCAFIATSDIGVVFPNGQFEVQGRLDHSDIRGCNLLVA
ncbi:MAG: acyl transferase [Flavobacteriales bacterium]